MPSNFFYLDPEFPLLFNLGQSAEYYLHSDPVTCLFKLRQFGERLTEMVFERHGLSLPAEGIFHIRLRLQVLHTAQVLPGAVTDLLPTLRKKGNVAVHDSQGTLADAKGVLFSAFKIAKWFYETYAAVPQDLRSVKFHMPEAVDGSQALRKLEAQYKELEARLQQLLEERAAGIPEAEQKALQQRASAAARKLEWTEAETRKLIDAQLFKAGWEVDSETLNFKTAGTLPQRGRNIAIAEWPAGTGWADYALFCGTELYSLVEAKKYGRDISQDLQQSKRYAAQVEEANGAVLKGEWQGYKVPFLFSTNVRR